MPEEDHTKRPGWVARTGKQILEKTRWKQILTLGTFFGFIAYLSINMRRDVVVVNVQSVPKSYEERGLYPVATSDRISAAIRDLELSTPTIMRKDEIALSFDDAELQNFEVPGTKIGLSSLTALVRSIMHRPVRHVYGQIILNDSEDEKTQATVEVRLWITQRDGSSKAVSFHTPANNIDETVRTTATEILHQENPYILARHYALSGDREKASAIVAEILQDGSRSKDYIASTHNLSGTILSDEKHYDLASAEFSKAIALKPRFPEAYQNWANALERVNNYPAAEEKIREALKITPDSSSRHADLGLILEEQEKHSQALAELTKALDLSPDNAAAYLFRGVVYEDENQYSQSKDNYAKSVELAPENSFAHYALGNAFMKLDQYDDAIVQEKGQLS